ncbi:transketolase [Candidatus Woesearchaeota archaeon CG10_big_fil_rev_8_21_14_0_10_44_13]|nr:MAG: transketolase [Candidatus Woesearchaeota archaeon CG10_big_fil_rev_8_21_14_0_10_44_13]
MKISEKTIKRLEETARTIRQDVIKMVTQAESGHPGGSLSETDMITALFFNVMRHKPKNPQWEKRDRYVQSKGHSCEALYSAMARCGYFPTSELNTFRQIRSRLQGHPSRADLPMIEASTGSLGQGLSIAIGMALGLRISDIRSRVYCMIGDGELDEGQVWEAAMSAAHYELDNLCAIIDNNGLQIDGWNEEIMNTAPLPDKFRAFGWHVIEIDGHDMSEILGAFHDAERMKDKPTVIIAETMKGKGVKFMENKVEWHGKAPTKEQAVIALRELNG